MFRRGIIPEWRYWPAFPLAALFLIAVVGLSISPPQEQAISQASERAHQSGDQRTAEEKMADYALALDYLTAALVVVAAFEIWLLFKADRTAREGAKTAGKQTAILAAQTDILTKQKEIARQEFISTHRPRLRIRHIRPQLREGSPIGIICLVSNIGATDARVESHEILIGIEPGNGAPAVQDRIRLTTADLLGGQSEIFTTERTTSFDFDPEWLKGDGVMFVRGMFLYLDDNNVARRTSIYRKYDSKTGIFRAINDDEYEYED